MAKIKYGENTIAEITTGQSLRLNIANKEMEHDIEIEGFASAEGGGSGESDNLPKAYHVSSVDELPTDAVDGSLAVVESDSLVGEWKWHETLNLPESLNVDSINPYFDFLARLDLSSLSDASIVIDTVYSAINLSNTFEIEYTLQNRDTGNEEYVYPYSGEWGNEDDRKIKILTDPDDEYFKTIFRANADRISGGYALYSRENGEWVSKGEI